MSAARRRSAGRVRLLLLGGAAVGAGAVSARAASSHGLLEPSAPSFAPDLPAPAPLDASSIAAPIRIPVHTLVDGLEQAVPARFGSLDERIPVPGKARTAIALRLTREPFRVSFSGDSVRLDATISYALRAWYDPPLLPAVSAACGNDGRIQPRLRVVIEAPLHVDADWKLSARSRVVSVARASDGPEDRCRMTFLDFDVTDRVVEGARAFLAAHTADIDRAAARGVDLRGRVQAWWATLQQPVHLADSLWLVFRPETVRRAPTHGSRDSLEIVLAMRARPGIVMGPRPEVALVPLPALEDDSVAPGLDLLVDAVAGYAPVTAFLQHELGGAELRRGRRTVRLDSLRVFGIGGGRLALEVVTSGDVVSRLFLTGTPRIDGAGQFSIPDLDYDVRTRSVMFATLSWLGTGPLRQLLRDRASWPSTPAVGWLRDRLEDGLNRDLSDDLRVSGDVGGVRILGITATRDALAVRAQASATARLAVRGDEPGPRATARR